MLSLLHPVQNHRDGELERIAMKFAFCLLGIIGLVDSAYANYSCVGDGLRVQVHFEREGTGASQTHVYFADGTYTQFNTHFETETHGTCEVTRTTSAALHSPSLNGAVRFSYSFGKPRTRCAGSGTGYAEIVLNQKRTVLVCD